MEKLTLKALVENIQSADSSVRAAARDQAGTVGAAAIAPLAVVATSGELEIARAANRAIQNVVYHAGRPGAEAEAKAVSDALLELLDPSQPAQFQRDVLWMSWQIAGEEAVDVIAALLTDTELREDARMALERIPGERATAALQEALDSAKDADQPALAHSLRVRGVKTPGIADLRLKPTKQTSVQPVGQEPQR